MKRKGEMAMNTKANTEGIYGVLKSTWRWFRVMSREASYASTQKGSECETTPVEKGNLDFGQRKLSNGKGQFLSFTLWLGEYLLGCLGYITYKV